MHGGGIRSLEALSPAAFASTICRAVPQMVDSFSVHGDQREGYMRPLLPILGTGSFDDAPESRWFAHFLASGSQIGLEFADAWTRMQREVGDSTPGSTLASPAAEAGRYAYRVQAALTRAREKHWCQELD
eukprot:10389776-Karenia_brevis.AAC.1